MTEAAPGKLTRQQLYDRVRETSKDAYILEEMKRLGFWPKDNDVPSPAEKAISRQVELENELRQLVKRQRLTQDPEAALREMRKQRLVASREKQEANRVKRNEKRHEKAIAWHEKQLSDISYIGNGFSGGLSQQQSDVTKLAKHQLPVLHTAADIANAMRISINELRFLCYARQVSRVSHYQRFTVAKKSGADRLICAPMPRLKRAQYWVLENLLYKPGLHAAAHGFVPGRSIVSNALPHVGQALVINLDLQNFFPTITYRRCKGLIQSLGYSEQIATLIGLILTEPQCDEVQLHGQTYFVANGERLLPQGSPASPAVSNLICRRLDHRLIGMANNLGFNYTRYADDMTFSQPKPAVVKPVTKLLWRARSIVQDEGFVIHPDKTRIMHHAARQEVTGLVVNQAPSIERAKLRRFRAAIHRLEKDGWGSVSWGQGADVRNSMLGFASFVAMVSPEKGAQYRQRILSVERAAAQTPTATRLGSRVLRESAKHDSEPPPGWWQAAVQPKPQLELTQVQQRERRLEQRRLQRESALQAAASDAAQAATVESEPSQQQACANNIDSATGRFRPSIKHLLGNLSLGLFIGFITKNAVVALVGVLWALVSFFGWQLSLWVRIALVFLVLVLLRLAV